MFRTLVNLAACGIILTGAGCINTSSNDLMPEITRQMEEQSTEVINAQDLFDRKDEFEVGDRVIVEGVIKKVISGTWILESPVWINFRCEPLPDDVWLPGNPCAITPNNHRFAGQVVRAEGVIKGINSFFIEIDDGNNLIEITYPE